VVERQLASELADLEFHCPSPVEAHPVVDKGSSTG
jgi:hypothetical protein